MTEAAKVIQTIDDLHDGDTVQFTRARGDRIFVAEVVKTRVGKRVNVGLATDDGAISTYMPVSQAEIESCDIVMERIKKKRR